jgi:hypothetical protein
MALNNVNFAISKNSLNYTNVETTFLKVARMQQNPPATTGGTTMTALYGAFQAVDNGFNEVSATPGLTAPEIIALGYFQPTSTVLAYGPFSPCSPGLHTNHTNAPGGTQAIGQMDCANLQIAFEGAILNDPNFPWDTVLQQDKHPTLYHTPPVVTNTLSPSTVHVLATALITYAPNGVPPTGTSSPWVPGSGNLVGTIRSSANYIIDPNFPNAVPVIDWIEFTITYSDTSLRRLLGNNPFATSIGVGDVVVTVPGGVINANPPMGSPVQVGNTINISGLAVAVNGIPAADINGDRVVTAVTANTFTFTAGSGSVATSTGSGGGLGGTNGIIINKL